MSLAILKMNFNFIFNINLHSARSFSHPGGFPMQCSVCPFGHVCLRWGRSVSLHLDRTELTCALECLTEVLDGTGRGFSLGPGSFCASHATDGFYYLVCRERVTLRLSENEARGLRSVLTSARTVLDQSQTAPQQIM
jgi:hypothetical protein